MKKEKCLDLLLEQLEESIDEEHCKAVEKKHLDALAYRPVDRLPLSIIVAPDENETLFPYEEAFENPEKMLYNELHRSFGSITGSVQLKDDFPLHIRSNHGIGIIPSMMGAPVKIIGGNMPWVEHIADPDDLARRISHGIPDIRAGLGQRVFDTYAYFKERLSEYPKCSRCIHLSQPDMQGPFDNAHLLVGADIFYQLYDDPEMVHSLLDVVTDAYIRFQQAIKPILNDDAGDHAFYVHGGIYGGKAIIKDDTAIINLSKDHFEEFAQPYNERIENAIGEISFHYCGKALEWHHGVLANSHVKTINFGNPDLNSLDMLYRQWSSKQIPIIFWGYNGGPGQLHRTMKEAGFPKTGMTLAVQAKDMAQAREILEKHRAGTLLV